MSTEQLHIGKDDSVGNVQKKFEAIYPNLCLGIFKHCCESNRPSLEGQDILISVEARMGDLNPLFQEAALTFHPEMIVSEFETLFFDKFGLLVQVSRKHKDIETEKFPISHYLLKEANREKQTEPSKNEIIYFRDVPYGC